MCDNTLSAMVNEPGFTTLSLPDGTEVWDVIRYHNTILPTFGNGIVKRLDDVRASFKSRDDDIIIYGYMKSGTHWVWEITKMLIEGSATVSDKQSKMDTFIEETEPSNLTAMEPPRLISTHLLFEHLPQGMKNSKVVVPIRNPKDVAVSMYHHLTAEKRGTNLRCGWHRFIEDVWFNKELMVYYTWTDYMTETWKLCNEHENIHPVFYEQLHENPKVIIKDLADFLGYKDVSEDLINDICEGSKFENMKKAKKPTEKIFEETFFPGYTMFRKGTTGDWRNHFSEDESNNFDKKMAEECEKNSYLKQLMMFYSD